MAAAAAAAATSTTITKATDPSVLLQEELIEISLSKLGLSLVPLIALVIASQHMGLELSSPMIIGIIRTFVQLSILGAILTPIFIWGTKHWWIVVLYVTFMVLLASFEASSRSLYYYKGMTVSILMAFCVNVCLLSLFAFGLVIQPVPLWDPQYVIPVVGMLLGNCVNGISLANNSFLTALVEQSNELEVYLCFGANSAEASSRLTRQAAQVGAMPTINSMMVIGLISIPGMMTGQILGGSNVQQAARYQMLIMYLIATITFGTILVAAWMARRVAFSRDRFESARLKKRPMAMSLLTLMGKGLSDVFVHRSRSRRSVAVDSASTSGERIHEQTPLKKKNGIKDGATAPIPPYEAIGNETGDGNLEFVPILSASNGKKKNGIRPLVQLKLSKLSRTLETEKGPRRLFEKVSSCWQSGDIVAVKGPSGTGKSQFAKLVAGLVALDSHEAHSDVHLNEASLKECKNLTHWRRQVRYVSQSKVDIPGTPADFVQRIASLQAWRSLLSVSALSADTIELLQEWGLTASALDREWNKLSGGEAQRVYLAIAVASRPAVLIMDESTSALDVASKQKVERSIERLAAEQGMVVLWITHDQDQMERMSSRNV